MTKTCDILVLNGPNLNMLGIREPHIYGHQALADIEAKCRDMAAARNLTIDWCQSNAESALIDKLHQSYGVVEWVIVNAAGLTHTSVVLRDALTLFPDRVIEVHLSNIHARESFRHTSLVSPIAKGIVAGFGAASYYMAIDAITHMTLET
jgi:3-dehydroquinate dehydratase-2